MASEFLYGAATSAHQVEGGNVHNDWWAWEKATPGVPRSGKSGDHYHRFREDFALAKSLRHNAHRLSIEWSRIEPAPGQWNTRELAHYREVLAELKRLDLTSFVTLHHFTNPVWLGAAGWESAQTPVLFQRYVEKVAAELGDLVGFWITINEPIVYALKGYWQGEWPPGTPASAGRVRRALSVMRVVRNMVRAHRLAYAEIHRQLPQAQVGVATHFVAGLSPIQHWWFNHRFLRKTAGSHDFIGVNYYFPRKTKKWSGPRSDMNWPIYPAGLTQILLGLREYTLPVYITENGVADARDALRPDFIRDHLRAVEEAQAQGVDVRGYLYWSLLDNFEWRAGFEARFGLIEVDYGTLERKVRPSAYVYKAIIEQSLR